MSLYSFPEEDFPEEIFTILTKGKPNASHLEYALKGKLLRLPKGIILNNIDVLEQEVRARKNSVSDFEKFLKKLQGDMKQKGINPLPESIFAIAWKELDNASSSLKEALENKGIVILSDEELKLITQYSDAKFYAIPDKIDVVKTRTKLPELLGISELVFPIFEEHLLKTPQSLENLYGGIRALLHVVLGLILLLTIKNVCRWLFFVFFQEQRRIKEFYEREVQGISVVLLFVGLILLGLGLFEFVKVGREAASIPTTEVPVLIFGIPIATLLFLLIPVHVLFTQSWETRIKEVQGFFLTMYGSYAFIGSLYLFSVEEYSGDPGLLLVRNPWVLLLAAIALFILGNKKCALVKETLTLSSDKRDCNEPRDPVNAHVSLYSDRAIGVMSFSLFGWGFPAGVMMFSNLWSVGRTRMASIGLIVPYIPFVVVIGYSLLLSLNAQAVEFESGPLFFTAMVASPYATYWLWRHLSGREIRQHIYQKGALQPGWKSMLVLFFAGYIGWVLFEVFFDAILEFFG